MLLKLAWRNIWRNKRRTIISVMALALGVMAVVAIRSVQEAAFAQMIRGVTTGLMGHAQVHGKGYQADPEMTTVVPNAVAIEARLERAVPGARMERRVVGAGLAASGDVAAPVMVMGIEADNPDTKGLLTLQQGQALGSMPARDAVIGSLLARELGIAPGSELVLVGQAADGSLANDRFTVVGIVDAGTADANQTSVFLHLADAQSFFNLGDGVHQIVVRLPTEEEDLSQPVSVLRGALDLAALEVLPWTDMLPELKSVIDAKRQNMKFVDFIVFLIVSLGILNTMTMSTFERTREFGVMASLGTRSRRVLTMVLLEAILQGLIGLVVGTVLAWALLHGIGTIDYGSLTAGNDVLGARLDLLRLSLNTSAFAEASVVTLITMIVGALAPAVKASRLKPVEATRYV